MGRLTGKVAVGTGSADGQGHAAAQARGRGGAAVVAQLKGAGLSADYLHCDVANDEDIAQLISVAVERRGRLDTLVNNAAIALRGMAGFPMDRETRREIVAL